MPSQRSLAVLAVAATLAWGCDRQQAPAPPAKGAPLATGGGSPRAAATVIAEVRWPAAATIDQSARAALRAVSAELLARAPVPVLVPAQADTLQKGTLVVEEHWYSFSATVEPPGGGKYSVVVMGTRLSHAYPHVPPARGPARVRGREAFITNNEGIPSAGWQEHGATYSLDVECASPSDARCTSDAFLRELAEGLVYVGGVGHEGGP